VGGVRFSIIVLIIGGSVKRDSFRIIPGKANPYCSKKQYMVIPGQ
jgi:hypothetical protein